MFIERKIEKKTIAPTLSTDVWLRLQISGFMMKLLWWWPQTSQCSVLHRKHARSHPCQHTEIMINKHVTLSGSCTDLGRGGYLFMVTTVSTSWFSSLGCRSRKIICRLHTQIHTSRLLILYHFFLVSLKVRQRIWNIWNFLLWTQQTIDDVTNSHTVAGVLIH